MSKKVEESNTNIPTVPTSDYDTSKKDTVVYRNVTTHKVEISFQKEFYCLRVGEDITITKDQEINFLNEHGRTNFFKRVI